MRSTNIPFVGVLGGGGRLRRVHLLALVAVALLLGAPLAASQATNTTSGAPPAQASTAVSGNYTAHYWLMPEGPLAPGAKATIRFLVQSNGTTLGEINYTLGALDLAFENRTGTHVPTANATNASFAVPFSVAQNATGNASYTFTLAIHDVGENATVVLATLSGTGIVQVQAAVVPVPAPLIPTPWLIGGGIVLLVAIAIGAYSMRERRLRARMRGQARSQVMREMELEQKLEKARAKDPGQAAAIQQEIRQQETVREKRRELQILEAKRADVLKNMDLLRKRHETGGLSKLQFDNMMAKRQADLAKIEAEIAEMERQDAGASAA